MCFQKISQKLGIPDYRRFRWFCGILLFSLISLLITYLLKEKVFYKTAIEGFNNIARFFWVLPFTLMGFSSLVLMVAKGGLSKEDKPWSSYIFSYFPKLFAFSLIIFSALHLFKATSGYIYYFLSAGLGLYFGYHTDVRLEDILKKN